MTGLDLITGALRLLGVVASGEALPDSEANDGLSALNDLIDSWSTESLLIPNKVREVFPLIASQGIYTMGTGGNFNTTRPLKIENALIQLVANSPVLELPMNIYNKDQFADIALKTLTSTFPLYLYAEGTNPLETINVWPVPLENDNLVLYSWKPLAEIASLTTVITLPPGYQRALRYALAIELSPEYGRQVPEAVAAIASESKAAIKRMNTKPVYLQVEAVLRSKPGVWNYRTGE